LISGAGILFADRPEGSRPATDTEQQSYLSTCRRWRRQFRTRQMAAVRALRSQGGRGQPL